MSTMPLFTRLQAEVKLLVTVMIMIMMYDDDDDDDDESDNYLMMPSEDPDCCTWALTRYRPPEEHRDRGENVPF